VSRDCLENLRHPDDLFCMEPHSDAIQSDPLLPRAWAEPILGKVGVLNMNDHARLLLSYLEEVCCRRDSGQKVPSWLSWKAARQLMVPVVLGMTMGSCGGKTDSAAPGDCDGGDCVELCADGLDNDGDGATDCDDSDCADAVACASGSLYGIVTESDCGNGVDDDGDKAIDCDDSDCASAVECASVVPYGIVMPDTETDCGNGVDDDGDKAIDCDDTDCESAVGCGGVSLYGITMPDTEVDCSDGDDADQDGLVDCDDPDCAGQPNCAPGAEFNCVDHLDNNGDGLADCEDPDCFNSAWQCVPPYAIVMFDSASLGEHGEEVS
jgi:hypothetical protein